jgi:cell wall-associated NlpC family hydrolase
MNAHLTIVSTARACIGTPFHAQGRLPQVGLDCAGLIITAASAAGMTLYDNTLYDIPPRAETLLDGLTRNQLAPVSHIAAGHILLFRLGGAPQHLAIASGPDSMIHAYAPAGAVVETAIGPAWQSRLIGIFSFSVL